MFVQEHLIAFQKAWASPPPLPEADSAEGKGPADWFAIVNRTPLNLHLGVLPQSVNRTNLLNMQASKVPTAELCVSIFAWGGMRTSNGEHLFKRPAAAWLKVAEDIRRGRLSREHGYGAFADLRKSKGIVGLGPAYFTKLLYFLPPENMKGYIMDQWLGLSMNLISGKQLVKLNESITWQWKANGRVPRFDSTVSDYNTSTEYEKFCAAIEALSAQMGPNWTPEITELGLISVGGRRNARHNWRDYVVKERQLRLQSLK